MLRNIHTKAIVFLGVLASIASSAFGQTLSAPGPLNFNVAAGSGLSTTQPVTVTLTGFSGSGQFLPVSIATDAAWLTCTDNGTRSSPPNSATYNFRVNTAQLPTNATTATTTIFFNHTNAAALAYTVNVSVGGSGGGGTGSALIPSSTALNFFAAPGGSTSQTIGVGTNNGGAVQYTVSTNQTWLTTSAGGTLTAPNTSAFTIFANAAALTAGTYNGQVTLTPVGGTTSPVGISVSFVVSATTQFQASPSAVSLTYQAGSGAANPSASVNLSLSTATTAAYSTSISYTGGGQTGWLTVSPASGNTSNSGTFLTFTATPTSLAANTVYTAVVSVSNSAIANSPLQIGVTLNVTGSGTLIASPASLDFAAQSGSTPSSRTVTVTSSNNATVAFTPTVVYTSPNSPLINWLQVSSAGVTQNTPLGLTVSVTTTNGTTNLPNGDYNGVIRLTQSGTGFTTDVGVRLTVTSNAILTVSTNSVNFSSTVGTSPAAQSITANVSSSAGISFFTNFTPNIGTPNGILTVSPASGTLTTNPTTLTLTPNVAGLGAGTYSGTLQVSTGITNVVGSPANIAVSFTITGSGGGGGGGTGVNSLVIPGNLNFYAANGSSVIQEQVLTLNTATGATLPFTLTPGSSTPWLSVSPSSGTAPTTVVVRVNTSLLSQNNNAFGQLLISGTGTSSDTNSIIVGATTTGLAQAQVSPSVLGFAYQSGSSNVPTGQTISVSSTTGASLSYIASATSTGGWLNVAPQSGFTNGTNIVATLNASALLSLGVGTYDGSISLTVSGSASNISIPVKLVVTSSSGGGTGGGGSLSNLVIAPAALNFFTQAGVNPTTQQVQVILPTGTAAYTATASASGGWLSINTNSNGVIFVTVQSAALAQGTYNGSITINSTQLPNGSTTVPVNLTVTPTVAIVPIPQGMVFNYAGGSNPPAQSLILTTSNNSSVSYTISTTTNAGGGWLSVQGSGSNAPTSLSVIANPSGLPAGVYTGTITVNTTGTANTSQTVDVRLIVTTGSGSAAFQFAPANLRFFSQVNGTQPPNQQVTVSSTGPSTTYAVSTTVTSPTGGTWLQAGPASGTTPGNLSVGVNPFGLANGTYEGTVTVTGGGQSASMPVQLVITNNPLVQTSTRSINFSYQAAAGLPPGRAIAVTTSNNQALGYTASASVSTGSSWLQVTQPTSTTPGVFGVSLIQSVVQTLAAGTYNGTVTINASGAENSPLNIPVSLNINNSAQLLLSSNAPIAFNAAFAGQSPAAQTVNVTSSGTVINVGAQAVTTSGGSWLTAILNTSVTPAILTVSANSSGLSTGVYNGLVTLSSSSGAASVTIPVELNVSSQALLNVTPRELNFGGAASSTQSQTLAISSTLGTVGYSVSSSVASPFGGSWLQVAVNQATGSTPGQAQINVLPSGLPDGTYYGTVTVTASGVANSPIVIPVTLTINNATALVVSSSELTFNQTQGTTAPNAQQVTVTSQISTAFNVTVQSSSGSWLDVTPTTGLTNAIISVRPNAFAASLPAGRYTSIVTVSGTSSPNTTQFTVVLNVNPSITLSANPGSLDFRIRERSTIAPATQTLQVNASGGANTNIVASLTTDRGGSWLNISPTSSSTPGTFTVGVNPQGLTTGSYTGTINFALGGAATTPVLSVRVSLTVDPAVTPNITSIANGASFQAGALSPGLVISLFGTGLGPDVGQGLQVAGGRVTRSVAGVRVLFDGIEAPILFVRNDQINCVVPYAMAGRAQASVQVDNNGVLSNVITPRINDTAPGIFTIGGTQAAMLNQDNSINGLARPAARGSIGVLYLTGEGALAPPGVDGEVTQTIKRPNAAVSIRVGGVEVTNIQFAGAAPQLVQGVSQINFVIPATAPTGSSVPIEVTIGSQRSQANVTIAVN